MVRAWYMSELGEGSDPKAPNMLNADEFMSLEELRNITGIKHHIIDADTYETSTKYAQIKEDNGYNYEDTCEISAEMYDQKMKVFFAEHLHSDEEIRYILDGSGYFDVRDKNDKWIRVEIVKDDLILLPAGIYHRFILDTKNYIKCKRLFAGVPVWTPINRPGADDHPKRQEYVKSMVSSAS